MKEKRWVDLDLLHVFLQVASDKTLKSAAVNLGQTPSAVSQSLKNLEALLGVSLFERDTRPLALTAEGRRLLLSAAPLLSDAERLYQTIHLHQTGKLSLRLGLGESAAGSFGPWLAADLNGKVRELEISSGLTHTMKNRLRDGALDVLLSPDSAADLDQYSGAPFMEEDYLFITGVQHGPLQGLREIKEFMASHPLIEYSRESSDRLQVLRILRSLGVEPKVCSSVSTSYLLAGLVRELDGWSLVTPTNIWTAGHFAAQLSFAPIPDGLFRRRYWAVWKKSQEDLYRKLILTSLHKVIQKEFLPLAEQKIAGLSRYVHLSAPL